MTHYTIGILFDSFKCKRVALILKNRPDWQTGLYNFPGGHIEKDELGIDCVIREFKEECGLNTNWNDWKEIGLIKNEDNYTVEVFTAIYNPVLHCDLKSMEDQPVSWIKCKKLPKNTISNLFWLIPFARNFWQQGNADTLTFGTFDYIYES
jgi:8-oxo-dGTP pyrophosphatase MutT (NUDIX family)